jgi:hypothetical protein
VIQKSFCEVYYLMGGMEVVVLPPNVPHHIVRMLPTQGQNAEQAADGIREFALHITRATADLSKHVAVYALPQDKLGQRAIERLRHMEWVYDGQTPGHCPDCNVLRTDKSSRTDHRRGCKLAELLDAADRAEGI